MLNNTSRVHVYSLCSHENQLRRKTQSLIGVLVTGAVLLLAPVFADAADPLAMDDFFGADSGQLLEGVLSANDSGLDGPADAYYLESPAANGTATVDTDSRFSYVSNPGFAGSDTFTYRIEDGAGATSIATVTVTVASAIDFITVTNPVLVTKEDTPVNLGMTVSPGLYDGGSLLDVVDTAVGYRANNAGLTPTVFAIPSGVSGITVTGFSTRSNNSGFADDSNDDYQVFTARVDLINGLSSGQVAHIIKGTASKLSQYSWERVPLGVSVTADPDKVIGTATAGVEPILRIVSGNLQIIENHDLETAYLVEFMTADGDSTNFLGAGNDVQVANETRSSIKLPDGVEPVDGKQGFVMLNESSAGAGQDFKIEYKGFSRILIDLESRTISGVVAAQIGETEARTVTYAFTDYPLIDQRVAGTPVSVLDSGAIITGDTTSNAAARNNPTIYVDANGELIVERSTNYAGLFTSMYTAEFYERLGVSSIASFVSVSSDDALFDDTPADAVDGDGKLVNVLEFDVPASATVGIARLSWVTIAGNDTNENMGVGFALIDINKLTTSGSITFIRASTPDLLSWDQVPLGDTFFGAESAGGDPLYQSNKKAGKFTDDYAENARFVLTDNADGSRTLRFFATSANGTQNYRDYRSNAHIAWLGNEPFNISGVPADALLSFGSPLDGTDWEIDFTDIPNLEYVPGDHESGSVELNFTLSSTGESDRITVYIEPVADDITIDADAYNGYQDTEFSLSLPVTDSVDVDGSETSVTEVVLTGVPADLTLTASAGSLTNDGAGQYTLDRVAIDSLSASSDVALSATLTATTVNTDVFDIDGDTVLEDGDNGQGVDEVDTLSVAKDFTVTINNLPTVTAVLTNSAMPVLLGTATVGDDETLVVTVNGQSYDSNGSDLQVNPDGSWQLTIPGSHVFTDNIYDVSAVINHISGTQGIDTSSDELVVDLTPPPAPGVTSQTTANPTPVIEGTTVIGTGVILRVTVNNVTYDTEGGQLVNHGDGTWTLTVPSANALPDATYDVVATHEDAAGNQRNDSGTSELVVDTTAPSTPGVTSQSTNKTTPIIEGTATVLAGDTLTVEVAGETYTAGDGHLTDLGDGTWTLQIPVIHALAENTYSVIATVEDLAGNQSIDPSASELTIDLTAPAEPAVDTLLTNVPAPVLTGTATVTAGDLLTVTVAGTVYTADDGFLTMLADGTWSLAIPDGSEPGEGSFEVEVRVTDEAGNYALDSTTSELVIDLTPPAIPTVIAQLTNNANPVISGSAVLEALDTLSVTVAGVAYVAGDGQLSVQSDGQWVLNIPVAIDDGSYDVMAVITDAAGNESADLSSGELIIDSTPPVAPGVTSQTTTDTTPVIEGTVSPGEGMILTVTVNGKTYESGDGNLVEPGDGSWILTIPAVDELVDGTYQVIATHTDAAMNTSTDPGIDELVVDTTAPATPGVTSQVTNRETPIVSGTAIVGAGEILTVTIDIHTFTAGDGHLFDNGDGTWQLIVPEAQKLAEGLYDVVAIVTDAALNQSIDPGSNELQIDLTAPAIPAVTALLTGNANPSIMGTATVNPGEILTVMVDDVTYRAGDGDLTDNGDGTWILVIPTDNALAEGTFDLEVTVSDAAGNTSTDASSGELMIDLSPPATPAVDSLLTSSLTPALTGSALVAADETLTVTVNNTVFSVEDTALSLAVSGRWTLDVPLSLNLTEGAWEVTATVVDPAGNSSVDTTADELLIDRTPPPAPGVTSQTTQNTTPVIVGTTVVGSGTTLAVSVGPYSYMAGDTHLVDHGDGTWTLTMPPADILGEAVWQVIATLTDSAGNVSTDSGVDDLVVDITAPATPGVTSLVTNDTTPVIEGTATVLVGETLRVTVNSVDYTAGNGPLVDHGDGTWTLTIPSTDELLEDTYDVTATVIDAALNTSTDPGSDELTVDLTAPVSPTVNASIGNSVTPVITGTATVMMGDTLTVSVNGVLYRAGEGVLVDHGDGTWTLALPSDAPLSEGLVDVAVTITDAAGNTSGDTTADEVQVDLTPPPAPSVTALLTNATTPTIEGLANLAAGDTLEVTVNLQTYRAGEGVLIAPGDGTWRLTLPPAAALDEAQYAVEARITDSAGNSSADSTTDEVTVDLTPPPAPGVTNQITSDSTPVIEGVVAQAAGHTLTVTVNGQAYSELTGDVSVPGDGTWSLTIPDTDALADGVWQVVATLEDPAGNTSSDGATDDLTVDSAAPLSPGVTSLTTNLTTPVIAGTATLLPGETLTVTVNGITYTAGDGQLTDVGDGTWLLQIPDSEALSEGAYDVTATVTDAALNQSSDPGSNELIIDLTAPVTPAVNAASFNVQTPVITGTATVGIGETLTIELDGFSYTDNDGVLVDHGDGTWTLTLPTDRPLAEGEHDLLVVVTDAAGNRTEDTGVTDVIIDLTPTDAPVLVITEDTNNDGLVGTPEASGQVDVDIMLPAGMVPGETVTINDTLTDTMITVIADDIAAGLIRYTVAPLNDGETLTLSAVTTDSAGNISASSADTVVGDFSPPSTPVIQISEDANNDGYLNQAERDGLIEISVFLPVEAVAGDTLSVTTDDGVANIVLSAINTLTGVVNLNQSAAVDGASVTVSAVVTDRAGNTSESGADTAIVDTTPPTVPTVVSQTTSDTTPTLAGEVSLDTGDAFTVTVNDAVYTQGDGVLQVTGSDWQLTIPPSQLLADGVYEVSAVVTDSAANTSADATANELTVDTVVPATPTVTPLSTNDSTPTITGTATVATGETLSVAIDGFTYQLGDDSLTLTDTTWTLVIPDTQPLSEGTLDVIATVTDGALNTAVDTSTNEVLTDYTAPAVPTIDTLLTNTDTPVITGTAVLGVGESLSITIDGVVYTPGDGFLVLGPGDTWTLTLPMSSAAALAEGINDIEVTVVDAVGNSIADASTGEITVDLTAPDIPTVDAAIYNTTTPVITGAFTTEAAVTLTVTANSKVYTVDDGALTTQANGRWTLTVPATDELPEGVLDIGVTVTDPAGNVSVDDTIDEITIDLTPPAVPLVFSQASDTGTPVISGIASLDPNDELRVQVNGQSYSTADGSVMIGANDRWTLVISDSLADGTYDVVATIEDEAGNTSSDTTADELIIDTVPPALPTVDSLITRNTIPVLTGTAVVADDETLTVTVNGVAYPQSTDALIIDDAGVWTLTLAANNELPEGSYDVQAEVIDRAGNIGADNTVDELTVDITPPATPGVTSLATADSTPRVTGTLPVSHASELTVVINDIVYTDGDGYLSDQGDGTWTLDIPVSDALPDALYQVTATLTDAAGNSTTDNGVDELLIDTQAPVSPGVTSQTTNIQTPVILGTAVLNQGEVLSVTVNGEVYVAGDGQLSVTPDDTWQLLIPADAVLAEGVYDVDAVITDTAGNQGADPGAQELTIDITAPGIPTAAVQLSNTGQPTITGTVALDTGDTFSVTVNGVTYTPGDGVLIDHLDGTWSLAIPASAALDEGEIDIAVSVVDIAGNVSVDATTNELTIDLTAPPIPSVNSLITNNPEETLTGTAVVTATDQMTITISGATTLLSAADVTDSEWSLLLLPGVVTLDGIYDVTVTVTDAAGNVSTDVTDAEFVLDTLAPVAPTANSTITNQNTPVLTGTAEVADGEVLQVMLNGVTYAEADTALTLFPDGTWELIVPDALADAAYVLEVSVTDEAGNITTGSATVIIDTMAPPAPGVLSQTSNITTPVVMGTTTVGQGLTLTVAIHGRVFSDTEDALSVEDNGAWSLRIPASLGLTDDLYEVIATVTDSAGNTATDPGSLELAIDTVSPGTPGVLSLATNDTTPLLRGTAVMSGNDILTVTVGGVTYTPQPLSSGIVSGLVWLSNDTWQLLVPDDLAEGQYDVVATLTDAAGNQSQDPSVNELLIDTTLPAQPAFASTITSLNTPILTGTVDLQPGEMLAVTINGITYTDGDGFLTDNGDGTWTLTIPPLHALSEGDHDVVVSVTDLAGNVSTQSNPAVVTVDTQAPELTSSTTPTPTSTTPPIQGTSDVEDGTVVLITNSAGFEICSAVVMNGEWQCEPTEALPYGDNTLQASVTDNAGNATFSTIALFLSNDFDNDGIPNEIEGDGDADNDGTPDRIDPDSDGDGIPDRDERNIDSDNDGVPDYLDLDSDNDTIMDIIEARSSEGLISDGVFDDATAGVVDTDGDRVPDYLDVDSDQDGLPDLVESEGEDVNNDGRVDDLVDTNTNGLDDSIDSFPLVLTDQDNDGQPDFRDIDSNGDGVFDRVKAGGIDANNDGKVDSLTDADGDGIVDTVDVDFTGGQDSDGDGIDDRMDADATLETDTDGDGVIDRFDADLNGDGYADDVSGPVIAAASPGDSATDEEDDAVIVGRAGRGGCVIGVPGNGIDPLLPLMVLLAWVALCFRQRRSAHHGHNNGRRVSRLSAVALLPVMLAFAQSASADSLIDQVYVGVGVGSSYLDPDVSNAPVTITDPTDVTSMITLGLDFSRSWAANVTLSDLGEVGLSGNNAISYQIGSASVLWYPDWQRNRLSQTATDAATKNTTVYQGLQPFARLGVGRMSNDASINFERANDTHVLFGGGLDYGWSNGLAVRAEVISYDIDAHYAGVSLLYRIPVGHSGYHRSSTPVNEAKTESAPEQAPEQEQEPVAPVAPKSMPVFELGDVLFATSDNAIAPEYRALLVQAAEALKQSQTHRLLLDAFADIRGAEAANLALSQRRLQAVVQFLADQGIDAAQIHGRALGETVRFGAGPERYAANRRVTVELAPRH